MTSGPLSSTVPRVGKRLSRETRENLTAYAFLLPWLLGLFLLTLGPMLVSVYYSFSNFEVLSPPEYVGLANYTKMFTSDARFVKSLLVTARYVLISVPLKLAMALALALLLNTGLRGLGVYRAIYYIPSLLGGSVAIAILWRQIFGMNGVLNDVLSLAGVAGKSWIASPDTSLYTLIALSVWQFGSPMLIFLAALKQVPRELYEAAEIDGAGQSSKFRSITLPSISPIILFNLIMQMISAFQTFTGAYIISGGNGGPNDSLLFYSLYLYQQGWTYFRMGYASAMAWVLLAIIALLTAINFLASKYWVYYTE